MSSCRTSSDTLLTLNFKSHNQVSLVTDTTSFLLLCRILVIDEDYLAIPPTTIVLNDYSNRKCFNVTLLNNEFLESTEVFNIKITSYELLPSSANFRLSTINLESGFAEITIKDDDGTA